VIRNSPVTATPAPIARATRSPSRREQLGGDCRGNESHGSEIHGADDSFVNGGEICVDGGLSQILLQ
jgi:hypothetical protein